MFTTPSPFQSNFSSSLTLAVSARWYTFPDRFSWIAEQGFGIEYTPSHQAFDALPTHLDPFLEAGVPIRHHGFFPGYEIGDADAERAERAMQIHLAALDAMQGRGEQVITIHLNLKQEIRLDPGRTVENLTRLVEYGAQRGIRVSLENLKHGWTSHPETVRHWAEQSGAMMTLDVGHAVSSAHVQQGRLNVEDFIDLFADRLVEAHLYERESDHHHAPQDMRILGPIVERLLETDCRWWTIELDDYAEILRTRLLVSEYLHETTVPAFSNSV